MEFSSERPSLDTAGYRPQSFHGHVLLLADGNMRTWGPYGKIENCIRPEDSTQKWLDFLNSDEMARAAWCGSQGFVWAASLPSQALLDEINGLMNEPCGG